uniref:Cyclin N-terminal domain-containing protein n=1 Tax=Arcella intermedia TaxID=1963864 RepID=A0A6B2LE36_9EUKA
MAPSVGEIIKCLGVCLYWKIKEHQAKEPKVFIDIFEEDKHPLGILHKPNEFDGIPSIKEIQDFIKSIYDAENLSAECAVMALIFIERLIALTNISLQASNWRRVIFGAVIISSKVWEDTAVWNSDFRSVFPQLKLNDLSKLEREYLRLLDFTVAIKSSIYAKYYFDLRTVAEINDINFPIEPLTKTKEQEIEAKSHGLERKVKQFNLHRSHSLESYVLKDPTVGMEDIKLGELQIAAEKEKH